MAYVKRNGNGLTRKFASLVKKQRARLYIARRCATMLLCWYIQGDDQLLFSPFLENTCIYILTTLFCLVLLSHLTADLILLVPTIIHNFSLAKASFFIYLFIFIFLNLSLHPVYSGLVWAISLNMTYAFFLFVPLRVFGHMYQKELANFNIDWNFRHARMKDTDMTSRWMLDGEIIDSTISFKI